MPTADSHVPAGTPDLLSPPKQARSRRTLDAILGAALALLDERGLDDTTVQGIVERAGTSVGSFYARFGGKDDLLRYLELRLWSDARARWDEALEAQAWEGRSIEEVVGGLVRTLLEAQSVDARQRRALGRRRGAGDGGHDPAADFHAHLLSGVRALLLERSARIRHPDPSTAVLLGYRAVVGALRESEARADALGDERMAEELARLYLAYLGAGGEGGAASAGPVDFFEVWA